MNQVYYNGDFWQCVMDTNAGDSPAATPEKWVKIRIPGKWRFALARLTYANLLRIDGQNDKAAAESSIAYGRDRVGVDELIRAEANEEIKGDRVGRRGRSAFVNTGKVRPVAASVILDDAYRLIGWDAEQLDDREKQDARASLSLALQEVWEAWWWRELMVCEQVAFAQPQSAEVIDGDGYQPEQAIYWPLTDWYYVALDNDVTTDPTDADGNTNRRWHRFVEQLQPARYDATQTYDAQEQVEWGGKFFESITDNVSDEEPPSSGKTTYWSQIGIWRPTLPYTNDLTGELVGPCGPIRSITKYDPRSCANPVCYELDVTETGTRVVGLDVGVPWVWSRRVTPILDGDDFDATATYEAVDSQDLVYDRNEQTGVFASGGGIFAS